MIKPWRTLGSRILASTRIFNLEAVRRISEESGKEAEFYVLDAPDWVNVVALTSENEVVLVEQFRHGTQAITLEIPGGVVDPEDETPEIAGRRELLEETGFVADTWTSLGSIAPNPAFLANRCHLFLARGARRVSEPDLDSLEEVTVVVENLDRVREMIANGSIDHSLVVLALQRVLLDPIDSHSSHRKRA